jgi:hypothetical protein
MEENNRVLPNNNIEADRSIAKIVILAVIGIIFCFFFGYFLRLFILDGQSGFLLPCFLAGMGFLAFFLLNAFFIKNSWIVSLIIFLDVLAFSAPFYDQVSKTFWLGILLTFLIFIWANYTGRQELENMLKIKFWRISKKVIPKAITALAIFVGIVYVGIADTVIKEKEFFISQTTFNKIVLPIANSSLVQAFSPGFDLSLPTGKLLENLTASQLEGSSQFQFVPGAAKDELVSQSVNELENKISGFTGVALDPDQKASDFLYEVMVKKFGTLPKSVIPIAPIIVAALIFLIIVGFSLPIRLIVTFLAFLLYEIFLALGFSAKMMEGRDREIIVLK